MRKFHSFWMFELINAFMPKYSICYFIFKSGINNDIWVDGTISLTKLRNFEMLLPSKVIFFYSNKNSVGWDNWILFPELMAPYLKYIPILHRHKFGPLQTPFTHGSSQWGLHLNVKNDLLMKNNLWRQKELFRGEKTYLNGSFESRTYPGLHSHTFEFLHWPVEIVFY